MSRGVRERTFLAIAHGYLAGEGVVLVGALARCDPIGAALWRMMAGDNGRELFDRTRALLAQRMGIPRPPGPEIAGLAIIEYINPACPACFGRGYLIHEWGSTTSCKECGGSGRRVGDDVLRRRLLGMRAAEYRKWQPRFSEAYQILADEDYRAAARCRRGCRF